MPTQVQNDYERAKHLLELALTRSVISAWKQLEPDENGDVCFAIRDNEGRFAGAPLTPAAVVELLS